MTRQTAAHTPDPGRPATPGTRACTAGAGTGGFLAYLMLALGVGLLVHGLQARPPGLRTFEMGLRDGMTRMLAARDARPNRAARRHRLRPLGEIELRGLAAVSVFTPQEADPGRRPSADDPLQSRPGDQQP